MHRLYRLVPHRVSLREYWQFRQGPTFLFLAGCKLLRLPFPVSYAVVPDKVDPLPPDDVPTEYAAAIGALTAPLVAEGFRSCFSFAHPPTPNSEGSTVALLDPAAVILVAAAAGRPRRGGRVTAGLSLSTLTLSGWRIGTTTNPRFLRHPPGEEVEYASRMTAGALLRRHRLRIPPAADCRRRTVEELPALFPSYARRWIDYHLARGVYVEVPVRSA
jgi:hypothetical protein